MFQKLIAAACVTLLASGCVSIDRQAFNKDANRHVKTVAVIKPNKPVEYSVNILNHPAGGFGLIGGIIIATELATKTSGLTAKLNESAYDSGETLAQAVAEELAKDDRFKVVMVAESGRKDPSSFIDDYSKLDVTADAVLDLSPRVTGYWAASHSTPYYPTFYVPVRLVDMKSKTILYNSMFVYAPVSFVPDGAVRLVPSANLGIQTYDDLLANPGRCSEGLKQVAKQIAQNIAADLK